MIHAFALEPKLVATWSRREMFRFVYDKFGLGTPRVLLELPAFSKWKRDVYRAANELPLSQEDVKRIEELFRIFSEHKCRRPDAHYNGLLPWLENAEREHDRKPFAAIVATHNPRAHPAVLVDEQLHTGTPRWTCNLGATPSRTAQEFATVLSAMLANCKVLHLVDPHFRPDKDRHPNVLIALIEVLSAHGVSPDVIRVHCSDEDLGLSFFEQEAAKMAMRIPVGISVEFLRWRELDSGGEKLHNRYVLTDLGGIAFGVGLDEGSPGQTDDLLLLPREQYERRWSQYVLEDGAFEKVDVPAVVHGRRIVR